MDGLYWPSLVLVIVYLIFRSVGIYNRFYTLKNSSEATLGQIRVAMKKRLDMIDQLLGAVKSYAKFEQETFTKVTAMRASVATAGPGRPRQGRSGVPVDLRAPACRRGKLPALKTSAEVTALMGSVKGIEEEIARGSAIPTTPSRSSSTR